MTSEVEYLKSQAFGLLSEASTPAFQEYEQSLRGLDLQQVKRQIVAADYDTRQQQEIDQAADASAKAKTIMDDFLAKQQDEELLERMQTALVDTAARDRFGRFNKEGLPAGLEASKNAYADILFLRNRAEHFKLDDEGRGKLTGMVEAARQRVVESHMQNLGMTPEEAEARVNTLFYEVENPSALRDVTEWVGDQLAATGRDLFGADVDEQGKERGWLKKAGHAAWYLTKGTGTTILRALEIAGAPFEVPTRMFAGAAALNGKSVEEIREQYPEFHAALQDLLNIKGKEHPSEEETDRKKTAEEAVLDFLDQHGTKYYAAFKEGAKGLYKDIVGKRDDTVYQKFAANVTDDPGFQRFIEGAMPMVSIAPVAAVEVATMRAARTLGKYDFLQPTFWSRFMDFLVPGRPTSYMPAGGYKQVSLTELMLAEELTKSARSKVALLEYHGPVITAGDGTPTIAFDAAGNPVRLSPGAAGEAETGATIHGRAPVSLVDRVDDVLGQFYTAFERGDMSDPYFREGMKRAIIRVREAADATDIDRRAADAAEARLLDWEKTNLRDKGQQTATTEAAPPSPPPEPLDVAPHLATVSARTPVLPGAPSGGRLGEATEQGILVAEDITLDKFYEHSYATMNAVLNRMGYPIEMMRRLVTTDAEARLFVMLHEEGHFLAKDPAELARQRRFAGRNKGAQLNIQQMDNDPEKLAMLHALHEYSRVTGRAFVDVIPDRVSPGSFAQFDPVSGRFSIRGAPRPDMPPTRFLDDEADLDMEGLFHGLDGSVANLRAVINGLGADVARGERAVRRAPVVDNAGVAREGIHPEDFNELGELFGLVQKEGEAVQDYGRRVYQAFVYRFGATQKEMASRSMRFPDADPELSRFLSDTQLTKMTEILHNWRAIKDLNERAVGTRYETAAADLALWYLSDVGNAGRNYRIVRAAAEAMNRATREAATKRWGVVPREPLSPLSHDPNAPRGAEAPGPYRPSPDYTEAPAMGTIVTEDGLQMRSIAQGRGRGDLTSAAEDTLSRDRGQVWAEKDQAALDAEGIAPVDVGRPERGTRIAPPNRFGPNLPEATAAAPDDAMARAVSMTELGDAVGADGRITNPAALGLDDEWMGEIAPRQLLDRLKEDTFPSGPVHQPTASLRGTPEQVRVMELEDFAGVKVHDGGVDSFIKNKAVNIFVTDSKMIDEQFGDLVRNPARLSQAKAVYQHLVNDQLARMANRLAESGGSAQGMMLFHRGIATAKAMQEVLQEGAVSARTAQWLDSIDLRTVKGAQTVEEAILRGMNNALNKQRAMFTMQRNHQRVVDRQVAEIFDSMALTPRAREAFITTYADTMSSPELVAARREINAARAVIKKAVGDACP